MSEIFLSWLLQEYIHRRPSDVVISFEGLPLLWAKASGCIKESKFVIEDIEFLLNEHLLLLLLDPLFCGIAAGQHKGNTINRDLRI